MSYGSILAACLPRARCRSDGRGFRRFVARSGHAYACLGMIENAVTWWSLGPDEI